MKKLTLKQLKESANQMLSKDELKAIKGGTNYCYLPSGWYDGIQVACYDYLNAYVNTICVENASCGNELALIANCDAVNGYMSTGHANCT